jgi:hypothetical protein
MKLVGRSGAPTPSTCLLDRLLAPTTTGHRASMDSAEPKQPRARDAPKIDCVLRPGAVTRG